LVFSFADRASPEPPMLRAIDPGLHQDDNRASARVQFDYSLSRRGDDI